jgi:hypothetical protein
VARAWTTAESERVQERVTALVADLPGVVVGEGHGHTSFLLRGTRFAWLLVDHHGDGRLALWVKAPRGEQEALVSADPGRYFVPPYVGPSGWVGANLDDATQPDWDEVAALLEQAWRMSAGKRAVAAYDASHAPSRPDPALGS